MSSYLSSAGVASAANARQHLLEQDTLMRRVLVEQDEASVGLQHHIQPAHDTDEAQGHVQ